ncbi:TTLL8 [Symbiodinium natans]|uniref:TTLL8 protein n=1 Tax=Symbiodinium natans TaxID=878477 RepID=A0A812IER2_9DINO|nr:TTLL8 [Symbiodinium natans]
MIKRALGLFAGGEGAAEDDDDSEDVTPAQRQKLERRLLPGAQRGTKRKNRKDMAKEEEEESQDTDSDSGDDPPVPDSEEKPFRGQYHCQLCPDKILLTAKQLEVHLQSTAHKRNERHFERAKAMGLQAYEAECLERAAARETQAAARSAGVLSKKQQKNAAFWKQRKARKAQKKDKKIKRSHAGEE